MPEIDETQLANYQRLQALADRINKHPEGRVLLQKAVAVVAPDEIGPEIRLRQEMDEKFNGLQQTLTSFIEEQKKTREESDAAAAKRKFEEQWLSGRAYVKNAGYTDEGVEKLEAFMEREGIANHKHAIAAFERENPPPPLVVTGNQNFGWQNNAAENDASKAAIDALWKGDEDTFLSTMIPAAISEVRGR